MKLIEITSMHDATFYFAVDKICAFCDGCIWTVESDQPFNCRESASEIINKIEYAEYLESHKEREEQN